MPSVRHQKHMCEKIEIHPLQSPDKDVTPMVHASATSCDNCFS